MKDNTGEFPVRRQVLTEGSNRPPGGWCAMKITCPHWRTERRCFAVSATWSVFQFGLDVFFVIPAEAGIQRAGMAPYI